MMRTMAILRIPCSVVLQITHLKHTVQLMHARMFEFTGGCSATRTPTWLKHAGTKSDDQT